MSDQQITWCTALAKAVHDSGCSVREVARLLGVSSTYLTKLMKGETKSVPYHTANALFSLLGTSPNPLADHHITLALSAGEMVHLTSMISTYNIIELGRLIESEYRGAPQ